MSRTKKVGLQVLMIPWFVIGGLGAPLSASGIMGSMAFRGGNWFEELACSIRLLLVSVVCFALARFLFKKQK